MVGRHGAWHPPTAGRLVGMVIGLGAVARLIQYLDRRSLWYDEAMLSLNIATREWSALLKPLDFEQAAPVAFLWAQRALILAFGVNEYALRAISFLAGIAVPVVTWLLARRLLPHAQAVLATALTAASPMLIRYSAEAKPYELDALVALGVLLPAVALVQASEEEEGRRWRHLGIAGLAALLLSVPAVFVLGGVGLGLLIAPQRHRTGWGQRLALAGTSWCILFVMQYLTIYRQASINHPHTLRAWEFAFLRPEAPDILERVERALIGVVSGFLMGTLDPGRWGSAVMAGVNTQAVIAVLLTTVGVVSLGKRQGGWAATCLAGGFFLAAAASAVGRYPFTVRLLLFAAPCTFILLAGGVGAIAALLPTPRRRLLVGALAAGFLLPAAARAVMTSVSPIRRQDAREVIAYLAQVRHPGEPVYVYSHAAFAWGFYATDWSAPDTSRLRWLAEQTKAGEPGYPNRPSRNGPVRGEGRTLVYHGARGPELLGTPTGRFVAWGGGDPGAPDSGWSQHEAARIRAAGDTVSVLFVPLYPGEQEPNLSLLQSEIAALGGSLIDQFHRREAYLYRYSFATR